MAFLFLVKCVVDGSLDGFLFYVHIIAPFYGQDLAFFSRQILKCTSDTLQTNASKVTLRGVGALVSKDRLNYPNVITKIEQDRCTQVPDRVKTETFDFATITKTAHELNSNLKRLTKIFLGKGTVFKAQKNMCLVLNRPFLPPPS